MKISIFSLTLALLLQHHLAAAGYPVLYVAPDGRPDLPCGTDASKPCSSLATAVDRAYYYGSTIIMVARGNYAEHIFISGNLPSSGQEQLVIEGGWDAGFSSRMDDPSLTTVTHDVGQPWLFDMISNVFDKIALRLENLTLQGATEENISAIIAYNVGGTVDLTISSCIVRNCSGPAIDLSTSSNGRTFLNVEGTRIENNSGGGVALAGEMNATIDSTFTGSRFFNNTVGNSDGGGIYFEADSDAEITSMLKNNILAGNSAGIGGALALYATGTGSVELTLINNTISANHSNSGGGGILVSSADEAVSSAYIYNSIITGNTRSTEPGDIHILQNSLGSASSVTANFCLIGPSYTEQGSYDTTETYDKDPRLAADFDLSPGSPARDGGLCGGYFFGNYVRIAPYDDIDGDARPGYGMITGCDIGADEYAFPWILFDPLFLRRQ